MSPRPQATGAKPLSKKELRASLDRVVEERDELREALETIASPGMGWSKFSAVRDFARAALRSGEGERHEG